MAEDTRWSPDGWSARGRIGVVVPHADVGPEAEFGAIAQGAVSIHGARLNFSAMRAGGEMDEKLPHAPIESFMSPPYIDDTVESLATSPPSARCGRSMLGKWRWSILRGLTPTSTGRGPTISPTPVFRWCTTRHAACPVVRNT